jgi:hypothetical protein
MKLNSFSLREKKIKKPLQNKNSFTKLGSIIYRLFYLFNLFFNLICKHFLPISKKKEISEKLNLVKLKLQIRGSLPFLLPKRFVKKSRKT